MIKKMLECILFLGIMSQVYLLSDKLKEPGEATAASKRESYAPHQQAWLEMRESTDPYAAVAASNYDPDVMRQKAEVEAQRILQTGDVKALEKGLEKNQTWLRLMGYGY